MSAPLASVPKRVPCHSCRRPMATNYDQRLNGRHEEGLCWAGQTWRRIEQDDCAKVARAIRATAQAGVA